MIVVADASPIICLARIEKLGLLAEIFGQILVPEEVRAEIAMGPGGSDLLRAHAWIETRAVRDRERFVRLTSELDAGEAAAIALAIEAPAQLLLMDERRGRVVAEREGLAVVGVVGVLLRAKAVGLVPEVGPLLEDLVRRGRFRLGPEVISRALTLADENPDRGT